MSVVTSARITARSLRRAWTRGQPLAMKPVCTVRRGIPGLYYDTMTSTNEIRNFLNLMRFDLTHQ